MLRKLSSIIRVGMRKRERHRLKAAGELTIAAKIELPSWWRRFGNNIIVVNVMILVESASVIVARVDIFKLYHIRTLNENVLHSA